MTRFEKNGVSNKEYVSSSGPARTCYITHSMDPFMKTWYNGNIFLVSGPLCGEFTGHRWIPLTKDSGVLSGYFVWSTPEQMVEYTIETPVIWDVIALITTLL